MLRSPVETRAAFTPAPGDVGTNAKQPIIPAVFPQSALRFLGVDMPTVPVGGGRVPRAGDQRGHVRAGRRRRAERNRTRLPTADDGRDLPPTCCRPSPPCKAAVLLLA